MKVILLERVDGTGVLGDIVTVKDGFARNFLLPRHKALRANATNLKSFEVQRAEIEARNVKNREAAGATARLSTARST
jgi:large subunit ribosomal protein L9